MEIRIETLKFIIPILFLCVQVVFFISFERKKPQSRDIVPIAVMSALGALGRALFAPIPSFKPTSAIVIITGMQFGPLAGFLTGSLSALASNMFLGQGPWTIWQMTAWGMMGFAAGILQKKEMFQMKNFLYIFGFASGLFFGWFMNLQYLIGYVDPITWEAAVASCVSSLLFDVTHGISTVVFLALMEKSWGKKLRRLKVKYGVLEERRQ
ncbi:MAG: ECF transporter S component [Dorea sp.]